MQLIHYILPIRQSSFTIVRSTANKQQQCNMLEYGLKQKLFKNVNNRILCLYYIGVCVVKWDICICIILSALAQSAYFFL